MRRHGGILFTRIVAFLCFIFVLALFVDVGEYRMVGSGAIADAAFVYWFVASVVLVEIITAVYHKFGQGWWILIPRIAISVYVLCVLVSWMRRDFVFPDVVPFWRSIAVAAFIRLTYIIKHRWEQLSPAEEEALIREASGESFVSPPNIFTREDRG